MILTSLLLCVLDRPLGAEEQRIGIPNIGITGSVRPVALAGSCPSESLRPHRCRLWGWAVHRPGRLR